MMWTTPWSLHFYFHGTMQQTPLFLLVAVLLLVRVHASSKLPSNIELCKRFDPHLKECLLRVIPPAIATIGGGIPSLGLAPMDPLRDLNIDIKKGDGPISINLNCRNFTIQGLGTIFLKDIDVDLDNYSLVLYGGFPKVFIDGNYEIDGRVMSLLAAGSGRCNINMTNLTGTLTVKGKGVQKNNKTHLDLKEFHITVVDLAFHMQFDNLFDGDEARGKTLNTVINENWKEMWHVLEPVLVEAMNALFGMYTKTIFDSVPYNDVFIN